MPIRTTTRTTSAPVQAKGERLEPIEPRIVITMVHGTFARNALWVEPQSTFGAFLRMTLPAALVIPFRWSGGNSVRARADAVVDLREHIVDVRQRYPHAQHALVAHSHGGNVVLSALADYHLAKHTLGVATLGTPFLHASLRDREPLLGPMDGFAAALFSGIAVFAVGAALGHGRAWWLPGLLTIGGVALVLLAASYIASLMRTHAERIRQLMPTTRLEPAQLAIVRTSADEAAAALSGARVAGGFASIFWSMATNRLVERLRTFLQKMDYFSTREFEDSVMKRDQPRPLKTDGDIAAESARNTVLSVLPTLVLTMLDDSNAATRWVGAVLAMVMGCRRSLRCSSTWHPFRLVWCSHLACCRAGGRCRLPVRIST